jgi:uncharacterized protein (TIGR03083 family)
MSTPFHAVDHIQDDGAQLLDAALRAGLATPVPSCPGWDMAELVWHIGTVWGTWSFVVSERITDPDDLAPLRERVRPSDDLLVDWAAASHTGLLSALRNTAHGTELWTWAGPQDVMWVRRRMAHETAVHRWDAERTIGDDYDIPIAMAADGIDEFLQWFSWRGERSRPLPGTAHIHCTDTDRDVATGSDDIDRAHGEWIIRRLDADGIDMDYAHEKGDVAIRGRAQAILLWLWGRDHGGDVEFLGDRAIADELVAGSHR